jgi:hypothetical protein
VSEALSSLTDSPKALSKMCDERDPVNETRFESNNKSAKIRARINLKLLPFDHKRGK